MYQARATYRIATWLACFALGLIVFVSPVNRLRAFLSPTATTGPCPEHMADMSHGRPAGHPGSPAGQDPCGYCTLLYHSPTLTGAVVLNVPPMADVPFAAVVFPGTPPVLAHLAARSRGPPVPA